MDFTFDNMKKLADSRRELTAKVEVVDGVELTIFSYMIQMTDTFDDPLALEFRGTTFRNDTGECISRPFPKFFNIGERPGPISLDGARYFTKHDGSMAIPVSLNGKIFWKTKKSFYSDVAIQIQKFYDKNPVFQEYLGEDDFTPIFEYVGPQNQIVLGYPEESLIFLGKRSIPTGEFYPSASTEVVDVSFQDILGMENCEGFVIHTDNKMVKAKTKWYMDRHSLATDFHPNKIIQATLDETIDDVLGVVYQLGLVQRGEMIKKLRDRVYEVRLGILDALDEAWERHSHHPDRKTFAMATKDEEYRHLLFNLLDGKPLDENLNKIVFEKVLK